MTGEGVAVVVPPELATGYRLAGVETVPAESAREALAALERLMSGGNLGVIAVYEPYLDEVPAEVLGAYTSRVEPVVVPLPAGLRVRDEESHRARISAMLSRAVGYHITFGEGPGQ